MLPTLGPCPSSAARCSGVVAEVLIIFVLPNGEEREERWPSVAGFRAWAVTHDQRLSYTAYQQDEDGEWVVLEKSRIAGSTHGSSP